MSSILTAARYIESSETNYWNINQVTTFAYLIQNILEGHYVDRSKICIDVISSKNDSIFAIIQGVSLGDGQKEIYSSRDIEECNGVKGKISIIYEVCGEKKTVDLADIHSIAVGDTIARRDLTSRILDESDVPDSSFVLSSGLSQDVHISNEFIQ